MFCRSIVLGGLILGSGVLGSLFGSSQPDLEVRAAFPLTNTLNHVYNGQQNKITLTVTNQAKDVDLTIDFVSGAFKEIGKKEKFIRNTTALKYSLVLPSLTTLKSRNTGQEVKAPSYQIPYNFHSEFKTGDLGLTIWVDYSDSDKKKYRAVAFDDVVTVVEPPSSWLDLPLIFLYVLLTALSGGIGYFVYDTYYVSPASKKGKKRAVAPRPDPATMTPGTETSTKKYEEDWIPEAHLKARKTKNGGATSTSEVSDADLSSAGEGKRGRKKTR